MNSDDSIRYFEFAPYRLAYRILGDGPASLLAFHGFGQDSAVFEPWQEQAGARYTIYAFDLFFHGQSLSPAGTVLTRTIWQQLISAFLTAHDIDRFSLAGFSLGGRFALITAELCTDRLEQLLLIAPDGITPVGWYTLATATGAGRRVFALFLHHLSALKQVGHMLVSVGLLHRTALRFAEVSLATPDQRRRVYASWTTFRHLNPDLAVLAASLNRLPVRVRFFIGCFDRIVPGAHIRPLANRLHRYELTVVKAGHNRLIERVAGLL